MDNSRKLAIDVIDEVLNKGSFSNISLGRKLNASDLIQKDKALVTEIVYGTIKYIYTLDKIINSFLREGLKSLDPFILNILRVSIYQIRYLDKVPNFAAVDEAVKLAKKYKSLSTSKLVNGILRNYLRNEDKVYYNEYNNADKLSFVYSFPRWMIKKFIEQYGEDRTEDILKGLNGRPAVTVRVNSIKGDYEEIFDMLEENQYEVYEGYVCPEAIRIEKGSNIEDNPLFKRGFITVQDESAMLVAPTMDIEENMIVLDLCSAPGGKTTHIAELMNNTGKVNAYDIQDYKLPMIEDNAKRLGLTNISCEVMDAAAYKEELQESAHRVLIDVPCSGLGIIRKKPEIKWNKTNNQLNSLVRIQRNIMKNAARYVKKDGYILYSTCTLNKEENEDNIKWFINNYAEFEIEKIFFGKLDNIIYHKEGYATILPNEHMDGFFICKLKRTK